MSVAPTENSVAVVGGGWAGCSAAVKLAQSGYNVALFEQARTLGGRARRIGFNGLTLDNGQHLLIGAFRHTLSMIALTHGAHRVDTLFRRIPSMELAVPFDELRFKKDFYVYGLFSLPVRW